MLESLTEKMSSAIRNLRGLNKITEDNVSEALKEVRSALLSADVHFKVAREFINAVKEKALGQETIKSINPGQQIVKILNDELVELLGSGATALVEKRPLKVMLVGLQGSGKTTIAGKLAHYFKKKEKSTALIAGDIYRPAAINQLETLAKQTGAHFYADRGEMDVSKIGKTGMHSGLEAKADVLVFDTAGRLQIDTEMIAEVQKLKDTVKPDEILLVADSALGQEAVNVAKHFDEALGITGIVLTKLDGDARGGAALSMKHITGKPIKFAGVGEKVEDLELFHPDRIASRILGMGDVVSLVEKAQEKIDVDEATRLAERMKRAEFNFEDFLAQMKQIKKMGSLGSIMGMIPGMSGVKVGDKEENQLKRTEAIIYSMTIKERQNPKLINGSRRLRIANGSGVQVKDVNALIKQFGQMQKMMKMMKGSKGQKMMKRMHKSGGKGMGGGMPGLGF